MNEPESQKEAQLWLRYAKEDLAAAEGLIEHILTPRHVCFLSQQSEWAVEARYPGDWPEATIEEAREALGLAREVYKYTAGDFEERGMIEDG